MTDGARRTRHPASAANSETVMPHRTTTDEIFFSRTDLDRETLAGILTDALGGADDGELFLDIRDGSVDVRSLLDVTGFGVAFEPEWDSLMPLHEWTAG